MAVWILAPRGGTCCACKPNVCDSCAGGCTAPTLACDSISASLTKCGFDEFGTPSSPPKVYLGKTQSGGLDDSAYNPGYTYYNQWSGSFLYNSDCSTNTDTRALDVAIGDGCSATKTITGTGGQIDYEFSPGNPNGLYVWDLDCSGTTSVQLYGCSGPTVISTTVMEYAQTGCGTSTGGSTVTLTLNNEYTTATLISNTVAALPSYPNTFTGTCSSYRNLSSDELTYSIRRFKYKFILPTLTGCSAYAISWMEGSTPKSYTWNGTDTETPVYGPVLEPAGNGTVGITSISVTCTC